MNKSEKARQLLADELFHEIVSGIEKQHTDALLATHPEDSATRERHYQAIRAVRAFVTELEIIRDSDAVNNFNNRLRSKHK